MIDEEVYLTRRRNEQMHALAQLLNENRDHDLVRAMLDLLMLYIFDLRCANDEASPEDTLKNQGAIKELRMLRALVLQRKDKKDEAASTRSEATSGY